MNSVNGSQFYVQVRFLIKVERGRVGEEESVSWFIIIINVLLPSIFLLMCVCARAMQ